MVKLYDTKTKKFLGTIRDEDLQLLIDQLEEECPSDTDYFINKATVELLAQTGATSSLVAILQQGLGGREEMEIHWEREE